MSGKIVIAGGAGNLGSKISTYLIRKNADVHILVRDAAKVRSIDYLDKATIHEVNYNSLPDIIQVLKGASCVVSALSGLREVMVEAQSKLLEAAIMAGVPKFIPSDYCIDYRPLRHGTNRNLDLRREFSTILDGSGIKSTSILNGMFTHLLKNEAPVILQKQKRIFFWGDPDQKMDFTSIDNTAEVAAEAALDESSPRWLSIAGQEASIRDIARIAESVYGGHFRFLRPGGLKAFKLIITLTRTFAPGKKEAFPAWQGMQYLHDMLSGLPKHQHLDNDRYPQVKWTSIKSVLAIR